MTEKMETLFTEEEQTIIDEFLEEHRSDVDAQEIDRIKMTLLHKAVTLDIAIVKYLLFQGADVNNKDENDESPLHKALFWGYKDMTIVQFLVSRGANVNAKNKYGSTPCHYAALHNIPEALQFLLSKGADVNTSNDGGHTPLHWATLYNRTIAVVQLLISAGADINAKNNWGKTPLHHAVYKCAGSAQFLISDGVGGNMGDYTPSWKKSHHKSFDIVQFLVSKGADVTMKDNGGKTPLDIAKENGNTVVIEYLSPSTCFSNVSALYR